MIDIESLEEIKSEEFDCPICLNRFPKNIESKIECSSKKHDICNECMIKWIKESIERRRDVKCVICNEIIYSFRMHQQRLQNLAEEEMTERRIEDVSRSSLERSLHEITQSLKKFGCFASVGFFFCFCLYIFLPPNKHKYLIKFFIFYISVILLIFLVLYMNRLYYIFRLHQMNRIHPEITSHSNV
jgi:hypothetical protein